MFIDKVLKGDIALFHLEGKDKWCDELKGAGFQSLPSIENEVDHAKETKEDVTGYDYLVSTPYETIEKLMQEMADKKTECEKLRNIRPQSLWIRDLDAIDFQLEKRNYTLAPSLAENRASAKRPQNAAEPQREKKRSRTEDDDNDADFEDEE